MNITSYFDGNEIKNMCNDYITLMNDEITAYQLLSDRIDSFLENEESSSVAIDGIKEHMEDYKLVFSALISANEKDILDSNTFINIVGDEHIEGDVILENKNKAKKAIDEYYDNELAAYRKLKNSVNQDQVDMYQKEMAHWRGLKNLQVPIYEYNLNKERIYNEAYSSSRVLFKDSEELRRAARDFLKVLNTDFENGVYRTEDNLESRNNLLDKITKSWKKTYGKSNYDVEKIFMDFERVEDMTDEEYLKFVQTIRTMQIDIPLDISREDIKEAVYNKILEKYNSFNYSGPRDDSTPFDNLGQEARELFVYMYEEKNPADAGQMNKLCDQFMDPKYYFPGVEDDIINIKFLVYTADEPYKSLYIQEADKIKLGNIYQITGSTSNNTINFNAGAWKRPPKGMYYTSFFHESGHAIDNLNSISIDSNRDDSIEKEVERKINEKLNECPEFRSLSSAEKEQYRNLIVNCIMNEYDDENNNLDIGFIIKELGLDLNSDQAQKMYDYVVKDLRSKTFGPCADVYGGITGDTIGYGHSGEYWNIREDNDKRKYVLIGEDPGSTRIYLDDPNYNKENLDEIIIVECIKSGNNINHKMSAAGEFCAETFDAHITKRRKEVQGLKGFDQSTLDGFRDQVAGLVK